MKLYTTKDTDGRICNHFALNIENAIQAHIQHFGIIQSLKDIHNYIQIIKEEDVPKTFKKYMHNVCKKNECRYIAMFKIRKEH